MEINPDLAVAILKQLLEFPYGIGEICAKDFNISHEIFTEQLKAMWYKNKQQKPLLSLATSDVLSDTVIAQITSDNSKVTLSITEEGKNYLQRPKQTIYSPESTKRFKRGL